MNLEKSKHSTNLDSLALKCRASLYPDLNTCARIQFTSSIYVLGAILKREHECKMRKSFEV